LNKPRILLVDDEPHVLTALKRILSRKYDVSLASSAQEAITIVNNSDPFCAVVCDIRMPGMNGIELLRYFKNNIPDMVRMVLSGSGEFENAVDAVNDGEIFRFHIKPTSTDVLLASIDSAVNRYKHNIEANSCLRYDAAKKTFEAAIKNNEFELYYQPQFDSRSENYISAEALIRWRHPSHGLLCPSAFLPDIETFGGLKELTNWVIDSACLTLKELRSKCNPNISIAINITPIDLSDEDFPNRVSALIKKHNIPAKLIEFEVLEDMDFKDESISFINLNKLAELGIRLSLDDFGTGYSAFGRLSKLPIKKLKIDKVFISDIEQSTQTRTIIKSIIELAKALKIDVIAEGVETHTQAKSLQEIGCYEAQGFYYAKPMPKDKFIHWYNCMDKRS